jgi:preprotein translocase subunit YajC
VFLAAEKSGGSSALPLLLTIAVFALIYFMVIRPQSRRRKQMQDMQTGVAPGSPVMTLGGLYGTVVDVEDDAIVIEVSPGVTNRYSKQAIAKVLSDEDAFKAGLPVAGSADSPTGEHDDLEYEYEDDEVQDTTDELEDHELENEVATDELTKDPSAAGPDTSDEPHLDPELDASKTSARTADAKSDDEPPKR